MHHDNNFRLENRIKEFDCYVSTFISNNIPKVHRSRKIHLEDECYNLIKYLYEAIYTKGNIRAKCLNEMLVTVSLLDHLLEQVKQETSVDKKKIENAISKLAEIKNMIKGWKATHESEEKKN